MDGFRIAGLNYPYQPDGWLPADQNGSFTNKHLETSNSMGAVLHRLTHQWDMESAGCGEAPRRSVASSKNLRDAVGIDAPKESYEHQ